MNEFPFQGNNDSLHLARQKSDFIPINGPVVNQSNL